MWAVDGGWCPTKMQGGLEIAHLLDVDMCGILHGSHVKLLKSCCNFARFFHERSELKKTQNVELRMVF